jgi:hypothetical protein
MQATTDMPRGKLSPQDETTRVWAAPANHILSPLAGAAIPKDRYIAPGKLEALVTPSAEEYEAQREAEVVFGPRLVMARAPNPEKPGGALVLVSRGEEVDLPAPELEPIPAKLSKQKRMNQRILAISDLVGARNSSIPEALVGQPESDDGNHGRNRWSVGRIPTNSPSSNQKLR